MAPVPSPRGARREPGGRSRGWPGNDAAGTAQGATFAGAEIGGRAETAAPPNNIGGERTVLSGDALVKGAGAINGREIEAVILGALDGVGGARDEEEEVVAKVEPVLLEEAGVTVLTVEERASSCGTARRFLTSSPGND